MRAGYASHRLKRRCAFHWHQTTVLLRPSFARKVSLTMGGPLYQPLERGGRLRPLQSSLSASDASRSNEWNNTSILSPTTSIVHRERSEGRALLPAILIGKEDRNGARVHASKLEGINP